MQHYIRRHLYRDKVTGMHYQKKWAFHPVKLIEGLDAPSQVGVMLEPCDGSLYGLDTSAEVQLWESQEGLTETRFGFAPLDYAQSLFVTHEALASRFEDLGELTYAEPLAPVKAEYENECCDFSNRYWVARTYLRWLTRQTISQVEVLSHTILATYLATLSEVERAQLAEEFGPLLLS